MNDDFGDVTVVSAALTGEGFSLAQLHAVASASRISSTCSRA